MRWRHWIYTVPLRLRSIFQRSRVEQELDDELNFHLDCLIQREMAAGRTAEDARHAALRAMGGLERRKEECRDTRQVRFVDELLQDLEYAARGVRRSPGFALLAVAIMALGIGANTAVFRVVHDVLLKPLPYRNPDRLVALSHVSRTDGATDSLSKQVSILNFHDWRSQTRSFEGMAYYTSRETSVLSDAGAEYVRAARVGDKFFRVFDVEPVAGRVFTAEEIRAGSGAAVVISYAYWQSRFAGDRGLLGRTLGLYSRNAPIVGVLPAGFDFPNGTDVWSPAPGPTTEPRSANNYLAVARLGPDVRLEKAQAEMDAIAARLERQYPESNTGRGVAVTPMREEMVGDVRPTLYLLFGAASVVLLIACGNTATLLLGKATLRTREVAVRAALGASRRRIVRQWITESLFLAFLAGGAGFLLALWASKALVALAPSGVPRLAEASLPASPTMDGWVLAFTVCVSAMTSLLFGIVPAVHASSADLNDALKHGGARRVVGGGLTRARSALVVAEIALSVMLLSTAGLLIKSLIALQNVPLGFRPENVLVMRATTPGSTPVDIERANRFFEDVLAHVSTLPGVLAAGATMAPPGHVDSTVRYFVDHIPTPPTAHGPSAVLSVVAPGTFAALGIPLRKGRDFDDRDTLDAPFTAVINEELARRSFPGEDSLGRTIFCPFDSFQGMTIVGLVGDVRQHGPAGEPMPECYIPYQQHRYNGNTLSVLVRTAGDPAALAETVRRLAYDRWPEIPVKFTTMESMLAEHVAAPRFRTLLVGIFAALAVGLAMAGVYGVMAYALGQRSKEIALRIALGASAASVRWLVLGHGAALTGLGLALGLSSAAAATRSLATVLFEVKPTDPIVYVSVAVLLGSVAMLASYVPAMRAANVDALAALREE